MNEEFVSFSLAKKLKEKGYPQRPDNMSCMPYYEYDEVSNYATICNETVWYRVDETRDNIFAAPAIHKVLKWLREEKKLHIEFVAAAYGYNYIVSHTPERGGTDRHCSIVKYEGPNDGGAWDEYEAAAIAGIEYCLDNLI